MGDINKKDLRERSTGGGDQQEVSVEEDTGEEDVGEDEVPVSDEQVEEEQSLNSDSGDASE